MIDLSRESGTTDITSQTSRSDLEKKFIAVLQAAIKDHISEIKQNASLEMTPTDETIHNIAQSLDELYLTDSAFLRYFLIAYPRLNLNEADEQRSLMSLFGSPDTLHAIHARHTKTACDCCCKINSIAVITGLFSATLMTIWVILFSGGIGNRGQLSSGTKYAAMVFFVITFFVVMRAICKNPQVIVGNENTLPSIYLGFKNQEKFLERLRTDDRTKDIENITQIHREIVESIASFFTGEDAFFDYFVSLITTNQLNSADERKKFIDTFCHANAVQLLDPDSIPYERNEKKIDEILPKEYLDLHRTANAQASQTVLVDTRASTGTEPAVGEPHTAPRMEDECADEGRATPDTDTLLKKPATARSRMVEFFRVLKNPLRICERAQTTLEI